MKYLALIAITLGIFVFMPVGVEEVFSGRAFDGFINTAVGLALTIWGVKQLD